MAIVRYVGRASRIRVAGLDFERGHVYFVQDDGLAGALDPKDFRVRLQPPPPPSARSRRPTPPPSIEPVVESGGTAPDAVTDQPTATTQGEPSDA